MNVNWTKSTLGDSLSLIRNGVNCKQDKSGIGDKISRIETIASAQVNLERVGFSILTKEQKEKYKLQQGDILFSHINSTVHVGKTAYIDDDYPLYHGINLLLIRAADNIDPGYLELFLRGLFWSGYWERICKKSVNQASVNQTDIKKTPFQYPPLEEQKQIVAKLDQCFEAIDKAKANAAKNLENAKELFQSKLNEIFSQKGEGWVEKKLGDAYDVRDGTHDSPKYQDNGFPLITSKNLKNGLITLDKIKYISEDDYLSINKRSKVDVGDILFAMIGTIGNPVVVRNEPDFSIKNVALFKVSKNNDSDFLRYYLEYSTKVMRDEAKGTTQKFVGLGYLRNFTISLPDLDTQKKVVCQLKRLNKQTQSLESKYQQELNSLEELKKSILQKAFEGEL